MRGRLFPIAGDWYEWRQDPPLAASVLVHVTAQPGGRLVLTGLRIDGEPTAELLRAIPVGRIEAAANAQLTVVEDRAAPAGATGPVRRAPRITRAPEAVGAGPGWETSDPSRARERPPVHALGQLAASGPSDGPKRHPDAFYREVARAYLDLAQASSRPAADLAEANGVPSTTAHRWVKEARRRGFLPPGRPGKAG